MRTAEQSRRKTNTRSLEKIKKNLTKMERKCAEQTFWARQSLW